MGNGKRVVGSGSTMKKAEQAAARRYLNNNFVSGEIPLQAEIAIVRKKRKVPPCKKRKQKKRIQEYLAQKDAEREEREEREREREESESDTIDNTLVVVNCVTFTFFTFSFSFFSFFSFSILLGKILLNPLLLFSLLTRRNFPLLPYYSNFGLKRNLPRHEIIV